jgi:hypothetical protein
VTDAGVDVPRSGIIVGACPVVSEESLFVVDGGVYLRGDVARQRAGERERAKEKPPTPVVLLGVAAVFFVLGALFWGVSTVGR